MQIRIVLILYKLPQSGNKLKTVDKQTVAAEKCQVSLNKLT
jgi:hypothetical protein